MRGGDASESRTSKKVFSNIPYVCVSISPNFNLRSFLKAFLSKFFIFLYVIVVADTFGKVNFIEVMTNLWKSDKPVEKEVVF